MNLFELTRRLIEIESPTENEKELGTFLHAYLSSLNYKVSLQEAAPGRFNVLALAGTPELIFSTHMDTVPPFIPFREDQDYLYGRGACDAKGILAAQIEAAEILRAEGENRFGLLFVVGEERNSTGAIFANRTPAGARFLINGEPTENKLAAGSKGALRVEMITRGISAHSAYPEMGISAVTKLLDLLVELRSMKFASDPVFGETMCNIGIIEGGIKANVIPDFARSEIMFRCVEPVANLRSRLDALIAGRGEIHYLFEAPAIKLNVMDGFETTIVAFTSDVPSLSNWGRPYMAGPGSILDAHSDHERISKKQLAEGVDMYVRLAKRLLSE
ncbi:MAG: peptidase dimerization domain protein [Acidobacteria bacterium]|jgi:acetylornithine deacetylase|nr:peptidase dimerization domain protein [Acidobacteriota bacterium]